jgi:predicted DNA-binding transcriptional regulator AlpA
MPETSLPTITAPQRHDTTTYASRPEILTPEDVAGWLQVKVTWLYDHTTRSNPIVPHLRLGGHLRFRKADVEQWLDSQLKTSCA